MAEKKDGIGDALGRVGAFLLGVLTFLGTNWQIAVSAALAIGTGLWAWSFSLATNQHFQIIVITFALLFGGYVGVRILQFISKPHEVIPTWDCAYCLTPEGVQVAYDKEAEQNAIQFIFNFRNLGNGPVRLKCEHFRATVGDRVTVPDNELAEIIVPRLSTKGVSSGLFSKQAADSFKPRCIAEYSISIIYGRHDGPFIRRYKQKARVHIKFGHQYT